MTRRAIAHRAVALTMLALVGCGGVTSTNNSEGGTDARSGEGGSISNDAQDNDTSSETSVGAETAVNNDAAQNDVGSTEASTNDDGGTSDAMSVDAPNTMDIASGTDAPTSTDAPMNTDAPVSMDVPAVMDVPVVMDVPAVMDVQGTDVATPPDANNLCPVAMRTCYSGAMGTMGIGACRGGVQFCSAGMFGTCLNEVIPSPELCNGVDDDCDGMIDDALGTLQCGVGACAATAPACMGGRPGTCTPGRPGMETCGNLIDDDCDGVVDDGCACTYVSMTGSDTTGNGNASAPFRTIATAIRRAATGGLPAIVCVAGGTYAENVVMRDGISVYGGYTAMGTIWPRSNAATTINVSTDRGVYFDASITMPTTLDGFIINGATTATNAAVTIEGSTGALVTNNTINGGAGMTSRGVYVLGNAAPTLRSNNIAGGTGSMLAIGVHVQNARANIVGNCATFDSTGRCTAACNNMRSIRGRTATSTTPGNESYGVRLENAPNTLIDSSGVCSGPGATEAAGVRISGDATGTALRGNSINAFGNVNNAVGVWAEDCNDASPSIVNNTAIVAGSQRNGARGDGVRIVGRCHALIDRNVRIAGGIEAASNDSNGVVCTLNRMGAVSRCVITNNTTIQGSSAGFPPSAVGVRCESGSCARIENNPSITGRGGVQSYGLFLSNSPVYVARNQISAGCASMLAVGIQSQDSGARIENNLIFGNQCNTAMTAASYGVRVVQGVRNEIDLHSNNIFGEGTNGACTSRAISFEGSPLGVVTGPRGVVRNNILHPGQCMMRFVLQEQSVGTDPRVVEHNDFWVQVAGDVLYRDEGSNNLTMVSAVNALTDLTVARNISAAPVFVGAPNYRLQPTSPCVNAGTAAGAPTNDFYGARRPGGTNFDIGAAEFIP